MLLRRETPAAARAGFTLMEMMIVVAIIVVLAGVGGVEAPRLHGSAAGDRDMNTPVPAPGPGEAGDPAAGGGAPGRRDHGEEKVGVGSVAYE